ncbi:4273_t:CDS:2 [Diversispora eburnea]|uniref:4273_t:CDS:1 n=1 Tax=Diversispora eburnea TaxID=1213867 RepID=A0A9N9F428_9GLOM|nr:4273_t:CDS:2 [Diversispora eburnea]
MNSSLKLKLSYFGTVLVSSISGTQYLFSAYSTALADRLGFNSVQINTIGSAANYGVFLSTPFFGYIVDNYGSRRTCLYSSFFVFTGFFCLAMTYEGIFKSTSFILCAFYLFISGVASSAAFGFPVAAFGLSAFLLSQINNLFFKKDTFSFLIFLSIATGSYVLLFGAVMLLLAGTGLMYINNVGAIIKYLYLTNSDKNNNLTNSIQEGSSHKIQGLQNFHVSLLSISSCIGRISAGIFSDITKEQFKIRRILYLFLSGIYLLSGHLLMGFFINSLNYLYLVTILMGLGYGTVFSIGPVITNEWFGSRRFGFNWGVMTIFAGMGGQLFNLYFGYNNDLHQKNKCSGTECYKQAFYLSCSGIIISIGIITRLLYRRIKRDNYQRL